VDEGGQAGESSVKAVIASEIRDKAGKWVLRGVRAGGLVSG
jgi:hypothetical protein